MNEWGGKKVFWGLFEPPGSAVKSLNFAHMCSV